jgi:hypothetical protein
MAGDGLRLVLGLLERAAPVLAVLEAVLHDVHDPVPLVQLGRAVRYVYACVKEAAGAIRGGAAAEGGRKDGRRAVVRE